MMMFEGQMASGDSISVTVTVNEQLVELPDGSVADAVTVVVPIGNIDPDVVVDVIVRKSLSFANNE